MSEENLMEEAAPIVQGDKMSKIKHSLLCRMGLHWVIYNKDGVECVYCGWTRDKAEVMADLYV